MTSYQRFFLAGRCGEKGFIVIGTDSGLVEQYLLFSFKGYIILLGYLIEPDVECDRFAFSTQSAIFLAGRKTIVKKFCYVVQGDFSGNKKEESKLFKVLVRFTIDAQYLVTFSLSILYRPVYRHTFFSHRAGFHLASSIFYFSFFCWLVRGRVGGRRQHRDRLFPSFQRPATNNICATRRKDPQNFDPCRRWISGLWGGERQEEEQEKKREK